MNKEAKENIVKTNTITASVWREDANLGITFSRAGKVVVWQDMKLEEKVEAVQNLYAAADFFAECIKQKKGVEGAE